MVERLAAVQQVTGSIPVADLAAQYPTYCTMLMNIECLDLAL